LPLLRDAGSAARAETLLGAEQGAILRRQAPQDAHDRPWVAPRALPQVAEQLDLQFQKLARQAGLAHLSPAFTIAGQLEGVTHLVPGQPEI